MVCMHATAVHTSLACCTERAGCLTTATWQGEKMVGGSGIKPPKLVEEDSDRTYIPRPVGEQHRPPPPKPSGPKGDPKQRI